MPDALEPDDDGDGIDDGSDDFPTSPQSDTGAVWDEFNRGEAGWQ